MPTLTHWAPNKEPHVSEPEASAACQARDSGQTLPVCLPAGGFALQGAPTPPVLGRWTTVDLGAPVGLPLGPRCC